MLLSKPTTIGIISENFLKKMGFDRGKLLENEKKTFRGNGNNFAKSKNVHRPWYLK